jgi:hypothetical protein
MFPPVFPENHAEKYYGSGERPASRHRVPVFELFKGQAVDEGYHIILFHLGHKQSRKGIVFYMSVVIGFVGIQRPGGIGAVL